jgi:feruloyl esterase
MQNPSTLLAPVGPARTITEADCTAANIGTEIPIDRIGEPVAAVTVSSPRWVAAAEALPARCEVDGVMAPVDRTATARPVNFRVWLPASWNGRAVQQGGGGMNGTIPDLRGARYTIGGQSPAALGFVTYGSDSGHQNAPGGGRGRAGGAAGAGPGREGAAPPAATATAALGRGAAPNPAAQAWARNDEAMRNLGYMQLKKTRDAAMVLVERLYGAPPRYNYFTGNSQGGREALTVAQRYPADYDGVIANVPIVNFSSLMLAPELIRIQEVPLARWVTRAKVDAIRGEFMRQCDGLDGLVDGVMNHYMGCRAIFDVTQGAPNRRPWAAKRCPNNVDPNPADTSAAACLTDGQISTLEFVYRRYPFATPLAHGVRSFGMWVPNTDPSGSGLIADTRFRGQEGAAADAPMHSHLGILGVTGFLMQNLSANPLDYREGGAFNRRREAISPILDSTNPDLSAFAKAGGKLIVTIGTNDTLASPGAQLDYYQSVLDTMGRAAVDGFARLFVIPQAGHNLGGTVYGTDGQGRTVPATRIASDYERFAHLVAWVEHGAAPARSLQVSTGDRTMPLCSYPAYPQYVSGPPTAAASYACTAP